MVAFPNAKVNLGLRVLNKREDGYHNIESCFVPVAWCDVLEIIECDVLKISFSGLPIPGINSDNLCLKAYQVINQTYSLPLVHIHLHKVIPVGAGIGGGSSDAAYTIRILNDLFSLGMDQEEMENHASKVGSDCAFFIKNQIAIAKGRGENLKPFSLDLRGKKILLINPGIHISTSDAYSKLRIENSRPNEVENNLQKPISQWKGLLHNDFEQYAFEKHPEIKDLKNTLYKSGAIYASMTGSGATVYGIFEYNISRPVLPEHYTSWIGDL